MRHQHDVTRVERDAFETEVARLRERVARKELQVRRIRRELRETRAVDVAPAVASRS